MHKVGIDCRKENEKKLFLWTVIRQAIIWMAIFQFLKKNRCALFYNITPIGVSNAVYVNQAEIKLRGCLHVKFDQLY